MKTKYIILSLLIFLISTVYSQNEKNNWHFGYNAGITFNTNPPSYIMSGSIQLEGSSSISDAAGNTILYGGGKKLYDNTSLIGDTLGGSNMAAQSLLMALSCTSQHIIKAIYSSMISHLVIQEQ